MRHLIFLLFICPFVSAQQRPNIIYIMSDDHDADAISAYNNKLTHTPNIDRIAKAGMRFTRAFVGNSICGPARATLLTGQHSHKNGMRDNRTRFDSSKITLPKLLQQSGYQTAIIGKWHLHSYPTGFDYWKILPGQGLYYEPLLISMNGDTSTYHGYATDVITNEALTWLDNRNKQKPFVLFLHHKAPHRNFFPPLKYIELFHTKIFREPSTLYVHTSEHGSAWQMQKMSILNDMILCNDLKIDPAYLMGIAGLQPDSVMIRDYNISMNRVPEPNRSRIKEIYAERGRLLQQKQPTGKDLLKYKYQWFMQDYLACVASVDENIGRLLEYIDKNNLARNTIIIYTSDQGFYLGENGWFDKRFMYDVSMQTPLLIRWPGKIKSGSVNNTLVQNIDYAPTILQMAHVPVPGWMQGEILAPPYLTGNTKLNRHSLYYHYYEFPFDHNVLPHLGVRGERYKLIYFYTVNEWELYDLQTDPNEQKNLAGLQKFKTVFQQMKQELLKLRNQYDDHEEAGELK